jgi:cellulose synthase (UDP-forming)
MNGYADKPGALSRFLRTLIVAIIAFVLFQLISIYLSWPNQLILGCVSVILGLLANRLSPSRITTMALMLISITATLRYGWWRVHVLIEYFSDASNDRSAANAVLLLMLISAEAYTVVIMVLGYMQTAWPLRRRPLTMPADVSRWPHVDLLIPTYNEPLSLVRYTALAALNIDWPADKLHVYILDDGTRSDFKEFAKAAGVGYIVRQQHTHAKAGNINHALTQMNSPYVAIFDCDHVPTRSFLQMTVGWMIADANLGMLQTPHHFYSPDPFERNLRQYKGIPNEGELFYGIIQDGNDFWNATFFCGSCALLRRSSLDEVGGIAVETVTEDAHTSLRMQKLGYNTAYINIPLAAGLATESLAAHVGQRIRWARGMIQILRVDNPLIGGKMKFTQRLCYFNAMAHFLYALPRLIFLCAPLAYMLLGLTIIPGYWVAILVYALPHLILASLTNSRVQGRHRHSFWNEIYEAVLAPYILFPTLLALINPKLGKFNVTAKGSTRDRTRFDKRIAAPTRWMIFLNVLGIFAVPYRLQVAGPGHTGAVIMNVLWICFNLVILGVAAAVAHEQRQRREAVRIPARIPFHIRMADGLEFEAMSQEMSTGGASVRMPEEIQFAPGDRIRVSFPEHVGPAEIEARVTGVSGRDLRMAFVLSTILEQEILACALYSRADAWISPLENIEVDRPLVSLGRVMRISVSGIYQVFRSLLPSKRVPTKVAAAPTALILFLAVLLGAPGRLSAQAQPASAPPANSAASANSAAPVNASTSADAGAPSASLPQMSQVITLKDMGLAQEIQMRGPHSYYSLRFTLSHVLVPRQAMLRLLYRTDPGLDPHSASINLTVNNIPVTTLHATEGPGFTSAFVSIPDELLVRSNQLTFEFNGTGVVESEQQSRSHVFVHISPASTLEVDGDRLPWGNNLNQLPLPIFDGDLQTFTTVPFVFLAPPGSRALQAAGVIASWLGIHASTKPVRFSVVIGQIPAGNAIVFAADPALLPPALQVPTGSGPVLALRTNPNDATSNVLVLAGAGEDQLLTVARSLTLARQDANGNLQLSDDTASIPNLILPAPMPRDVAPRWLPLHRGTPITSCGNPAALESDGSSPIPLYFHVPPDLSYGEEQNVELHLNYKYNAAPIAVGSALRVYLNGNLINEIPLAPGKGTLAGERTILVPVAAIRPFGNTVLFNFDFIPTDRNAAMNGTAALHGEISCTSTLDLNGLALWTAMPNLELFANAGFPFTRLPDLADTDVILPTVPTPDEIGLFLHLMSHFGAQTGYPILRVTVDPPNTVIHAGRDYLILGTLANQAAFTSLGAELPVTIDASGLHVKQQYGPLATFTNLQAQLNDWWSRLRGVPVQPRLPRDGSTLPDAMVEEIKSPASPDRSIVVVALRAGDAADTFETVFADRSQSQDITGSVSLLSNSQFDSYLLGGSSYHVGNITWYAWMRIWLTHHFLLLLLVATFLSFLAAYWANAWMSWHAHQRLKIEETLLPLR